MKNKHSQNKRIVFLILILFGFVINYSQAQPAKWTIMVYLDADNNLEDAGIIDFNEMEAVGSTDSVNIIVQFDRVTGYVTSDGNWTDTRRFRVLHDDNLSAITTSPVEIMGEQNMGDPEVLKEFIEWSTANYPADHYALILWNHGGGMWKKGEPTRKTNPKDKDVCYDDTDNDYLSNFEVGNAIKTSGIHFDIVSYDACLMGMIEVAYQIRDMADIMVASEETIPWDGYNYTGFLEGLVNDPQMTTKTLAENMIDVYSAFYPSDYVTLSAVDLHSIRNVVAKTDTLVSRIIENDAAWDAVGEAWNNTQYFADLSYRDLWSFASLVNSGVEDTQIQEAATELMLSIDNAVIDFYASEGFNFARGISIYFPESSNYYSEYEDPSAGRDFADFLHVFHSEFYNDFTEPNNHFATANIETYYSTVQGRLTDSTDVDIYRIFYQGYDNADITLNTSFNVDMFLYTVIDTIITKVDSSVNAGSTSETISITGRDTGYYYILLRPVETSEDQYSISFNGNFPEFDLFSKTPVTYAYDDGKPDAEYYSSLTDTGVGMVYTAYGVLQGLWYYITDLAAGTGGIQGNINLNLYYYDDYYSYDIFQGEPYPVYPEHVGWNYVDLSASGFRFYFEKIAIGFSWDGLSSATIGVDSSFTFGNSLSFNNGSWNKMEDSILIYIRPVFVIEPYVPPINCYCNNLTILAEPSGTFTDGSGDNMYGSDCSCAWLIQPQGVTSITLTVNELETVADDDFLNIYDGNSDNADLLASVNGEIVNYSVTSSGGALYVVFESNSYLSARGWEVSYTSFVSDAIDDIDFSAGNWRIYPNPGDGIIQLETGNNRDIAASYEVIDLMGQIIFQGAISPEENRVSIDISSRPQGIYYIKMKNESGLRVFKYVLN